jgi:peptidyl-prolyl cis-trans isomerase C
MNSRRVLVLALAAAVAVAGLASSRVLAQDKVVATVNGKALTETDMKLAEAEIGGDLGNLPEATKRRVLVEYLIENQLFANAAEQEKMAAGEAFEDRMQYWRRRALRDTYFDKTVKDSIGEAAAKTFYDDQVKTLKPEEEVQARHILVESEAQAKELADKVAKGEDFAALAKEHSRDPGTKDDGGLLPFFSRGQMVPQFEEAAFKLKKGEVSPPVQSQFGWHLIKVEERREKQPPTFEQVKDRILASMIHRKAQSLANNLREQSKVEYVDEEIKKQVDEQEKQADAQKRMLEEQIRKLEAEQKK